MRKSLILSGLVVFAGAVSIYYLGEERLKPTPGGVVAKTQTATSRPNDLSTAHTAVEISAGEGKEETSDSTVAGRPKEENLAKVQVVLDPEQLITPPVLAIGGEPPQPREFNLEVRGDGVGYLTSIAAGDDTVQEPLTVSASVDSLAVLPQVPDRQFALRAKLKPEPRQAIQQAREEHFANQLEQHPERAELNRLRQRLEQK